MLEREIIVTLEGGLHARPVAELVKAMREYSCEVDIQIVEKTYNAKSILGLMSAAIRQGDRITIITNGEDEEAAMKWVSQFLGNYISL